MRLQPRQLAPDRTHSLPTRPSFPALSDVNIHTWLMGSCHDPALKLFPPSLREPSCLPDFMFCCFCLSSTHFPDLTVTSSLGDPLLLHAQPTWWFTEDFRDRNVTQTWTVRTSVTASGVSMLSKPSNNLQFWHFC